MKLGNWTDDPCYYVTVVDAGRVGYLAGPYISHDKALSKVAAARLLASKRDPFSHFYSFGTAKRSNGYLNSLFGADI